MPVEDRSPEGGSGDRVTIASTRAVTPGEDEFELPRPRLPEQRHRRPLVEPLALRILHHLPHHGFRMLGPVQAEKDLPHQIPLIGTEGVLD